MAAVDVTTETDIRRPRSVVASYTTDLANATSWYQNIKSVEWKTPPPLAIGSQVAFVARFLGRPLAYTYEITDYTPGPFPMETTYTWADTTDGGTKMNLRNRGEPAGFSRIVAPFMATAVRRANVKDLRRLKEILEGSDR